MIDFETKILFNLLWMGYVGGRHTSDNVIKNFPKTKERRQKKPWKKCYNKGYLILKPTHYGQEISINPRILKDIRKMPGIIEMENKYRI